MENCVEKIYCCGRDNNENALAAAILANNNNNNRYGYGYLILANGAIHQLWPDSEISNGVQGYNSSAINIEYIGGIDKNGEAIDNRTNEQKQSLIRLLLALRKKYPEAKILGHRDFSPDTDGDGIVEPHEWTKMCPCFDAKEEYKDLLSWR